MLLVCRCVCVCVCVCGHFDVWVCVRLPWHSAPGKLEAEEFATTNATSLMIREQGVELVGLMKSASVWVWVSGSVSVSGSVWVLVVR